VPAITHLALWITLMILRRPESVVI